MSFSPLFQEPPTLKYEPRVARAQHVGIDVDAILKLTANHNPILDCGCGVGGWGIMIRVRYPYKTVIGIDLWRPYLLFAQNYDAYALLTKGSAQKMPFRNDTFDLCLAIELIEHLTQKDGEAFIKEAKRVSNHVILTTPTNPRETSETVPTENHRSLWTQKTLQNRGFKLIKEEKNHLVMTWRSTQPSCSTTTGAS